MVLNFQNLLHLPPKRHLLNSTKEIKIKVQPREPWIASVPSLRTVALQDKKNYFPENYSSAAIAYPSTD